MPGYIDFHNNEISILDYGDIVVAQHIFSRIPRACPHGC